MNDDKKDPAPRWYPLVALYGRRWRLYSLATLVTILVTGAWTGLEATRLAAQQPTPWLGVAERINIGAYLLWVAVLAVTLLRSRIPAGQADGLGSYRTKAVAPVTGGLKAS